MVAETANRAPQSDTVAAASGDGQTLTHSTTSSQQSASSELAPTDKHQPIWKIDPPVTTKVKPTGDPALYAPPSQSLASWPTGIINSSEAFTPATVFLTTNRWQGIVGGEKMLVLAGKAGPGEQSDTARSAATGELRIVDSGPSDPGHLVKGHHLVKVYQRPGTGPMKIIAQHGDTLTVAAADGSRFHLDLTTDGLAAG